MRNDWGRFYIPFRPEYFNTGFDRGSFNVDGSMTTKWENFEIYYNWIVRNYLKRWYSARRCGTGQNLRHNGDWAFKTREDENGNIIQLHWWEVKRG